VQVETPGAAALSDFNWDVSRGWQS
jgi:hypothetical protein